MKLLFSGSLIYIAAMAIANPIYEKSNVVWRNVLNYTLSDTVLPSHYYVRLLIGTDYFIGEYKITIHIIYATQHISFHIPNFSNITKMSLSRICDTSSIATYEIKYINYKKNNIVMLYFDDALLPNKYMLKMQLNLENNFIRNNFTTNSFGISDKLKGEDIW